MMSETTSMHQPAASGYEVTRFNALRHGVLSAGTPSCRGRTKTNTASFSMRSSPNTNPRGRLRNTS